MCVVHRTLYIDTMFLYNWTAIYELMFRVVHWPSDRQAKVLISMPPLHDD